MANAVPNSFKSMLLKGQIDGDGDTFKIILMNSSYTFDPDNHSAYANVSAWELTNGSGYTTGGATLSGVTVTKDDSGNVGKIAWSDAQWNATGTLVPAGAIIYDDSTSTGSGDDYTDAIVAYIDAGGTYTIPSGAPVFVKNIVITLT